jgi:hypothetical protein
MSVNIKDRGKGNLESITRRRSFYFSLEIFFARFLVAFVALNALLLLCVLVTIETISLEPHIIDYTHRIVVPRTAQLCIFATICYIEISIVGCSRRPTFIVLKIASSCL